MIGPLAQFTGRWRLCWLRLSSSFAGVFTAKVNSLFFCVGEKHPTKNPTLLWCVVVLVVFFKWFDTCKTHFTRGTSRSHKGERSLLGVILVLVVSAFIYFFHLNWTRWRGQFLNSGLPNFLHISFIWLAQKIGAACAFKANGASFPSRGLHSHQSSCSLTPFFFHLLLPLPAMNPERRTSIGPCDNSNFPQDSFALPCFNNRVLGHSSLAQWKKILRLEGKFYSRRWYLNQNDIDISCQTKLTPQIWLQSKILAGQAACSD